MGEKEKQRRKIRNSESIRVALCDSRLFKTAQIRTNDWAAGSASFRVCTLAALSVRLRSSSPSSMSSNGFVRTTMRKSSEVDLDTWFCDSLQNRHNTETRVTARSPDDTNDVFPLIGKFSTIERNVVKDAHVHRPHTEHLLFAPAKVKPKSPLSTRCTASERHASPTQSFDRTANCSRGPLPSRQQSADNALSRDVLGRRMSKPTVWRTLWNRMQTICLLRNPAIESLLQEKQSSDQDDKLNDSTNSKTKNRTDR